MIGQITVDDTVPATPGPWHRRLGGNALYAAAGARLWCPPPERVGIVARVPASLPFDLQHVLEHRGSDAEQLTAMLAGATAFLPSQAEVQHFDAPGGWPAVITALCRTGFQEVLLKRGAAGALLAEGGAESVVPVPAARAAVRDLTGAGDAFSGAYAASRALGHAPKAAAARAAVAAAMVVECEGAQQALALRPSDAGLRLTEY